MKEKSIKLTKRKVNDSYIFELETNGSFPDLRPGHEGLEHKGKVWITFNSPSEVVEFVCEILNSLEKTTRRGKEL